MLVMPDEGSCSNLRSSRDAVVRERPVALGYKRLKVHWVQLHLVAGLRLTRPVQVGKFSFDILCVHSNSIFD